MVSVTVVVCDLPPPVPFTVIVYVPVLARELTVIVIFDVPLPGAGMEPGLRLTVTRDGTPDADKAIAELKPLFAAVVMVGEPELPL